MDAVAFEDWRDALGDVRARIDMRVFIALRAVEVTPVGAECVCSIDDQVEEREMMVQGKNVESARIR